MAISPEEIETKAFVVTLRGYDQGEVDRWLRDVAEQHRMLLLELELTKERQSRAIAQLRTDALADIEASHHAVQRAIARVRAAAQDDVDAAWKRSLEIDRFTRQRLEKPLHSACPAGELDEEQPLVSGAGVIDLSDTAPSRVVNLDELTANGV